MAEDQKFKVRAGCFGDVLVTKNRNQIADIIKKMAEVHGNRTQAQPCKNLKLQSNFRQFLILKHFWNTRRPFFRRYWPGQSNP